MKIRKILMTFMLVLSIMPIASAIYMGEATSEPTIITLTIGDFEDVPNEDNPKDIEDNRHSQLESQRQNDEAIETKLREIIYGDWDCINNRLQRKVTTLNHVEYEYGQICGFDNYQNSEEKFEKPNLFTAFNILLILFIILSLILTIAFILNKY